MRLALPGEVFLGFLEHAASQEQVVMTVHDWQLRLSYSRAWRTEIPCVTWNVNVPLQAIASQTMIQLSKKQWTRTASRKGEY